MKKISTNVTKGVQILLGNPKKAIVKLSLPLMTAMLVQALYNLVDGIWVAGLGPNSLAAIGLFFPIFMIIISLASGIGAGASSVISRKIGEGNKKEADNAATQAVILSTSIGIVSTVVSLFIIRYILESIGTSGETLELSLKYSRIILFFIPLFMFNNVANGVLRGEGDTKRSMYAMTLGSVLNMVLDPLFIYGFDFGISGAAYATVISVAVSATFLFYWLFFKKDTYVSLKFRGFRYDSKILLDILKVGIPASLSQISMSIAVFVLNVFIVKAGGDTGVAIFTSSWRIINFGTVPLVGIAMAVTSVTGAAYGERNGRRLEEAHLFAIKFGFFIGLSVMLVIVLFAPQIALAFTYSKAASAIFEDLVRTLRIMSLFLPGVPFGMFTSSMFQGIGQGGKSLVVSVMRTVVMQVFFSWLFTFILKVGLEGVWWGVVTGNATSSFIAFTWGRLTVNKLKENFGR